MKVLSLTLVEGMMCWPLQRQWLEKLVSRNLLHIQTNDKVLRIQISLYNIVQMASASNYNCILTGDLIWRIVIPIGWLHSSPVSDFWGLTTILHWRMLFKPFICHLALALQRMNLSFTYLQENVISQICTHQSETSRVIKHKVEKWTNQLGNSRRKWCKFFYKIFHKHLFQVVTELTKIQYEELRNASLLDFNW